LQQSRSSTQSLPAPVQEGTDPIWGNSSSVHENISLNVVVEWVSIVLLLLQQLSASNLDSGTGYTVGRISWFLAP
jgi:hypothetical protein